MAEIRHEGTRGTGVLEDSRRNQDTFGVWPLTGTRVFLHLERLLLPSNLLLPSASAPHPTPPPKALPQPSRAWPSGTPTSLPPLPLFLILDLSSPHRPPTAQT